MSKVRSETVDPLQIQVFHAFNRCVRRTFLCGVDALSGRDYSHRKQWLRERLEFLLSIFAFDLATYAIMSNHYHLVLRSRPDVVSSWTDEEVVYRNLRLQGKRWFRPSGEERSTTQAEVERIVQDREEVTRIRSKLSDLSHLMAYLNENISKQGNKEDEATGAFWEGTFEADTLDDEESILA
ncbi:MAG: hypothetical protein AAFN77_12580, partial [Planctomycetota bacterium]